MSDFDDLYQEVILDHYRSPRGAARLDHVPESAVHENPLCGDRIKIEVAVVASGAVVDGDGPDCVLKSVRFEASGCAISVASASLMSQALEGRSIEEARLLAGNFIRALRGELPLETLDELGDLAALKGVARFPARVKCATLPWHALLDTLAGPG
jgi:nitrogen fixation NifU-like protein